MRDLVKTIYLVRHGATGYNDRDLFQGVLDNSLSEKGKQESEKLAQRLKDETIDIMFHSPLTRSRQTAEIINRYHQAKLCLIDGFIEMDMGDWEGLNFFKVVKEQAEIYQQLVSDPSAKVPGGESFDQVFKRVKSGVDKVIASKEKSILISAHAMVNRAILGHLLGLEPIKARKFRMDNCAFSRLLVFRTLDGQNIVVDIWNSVDHLNPMA
jgi:broad specificity phosphatase PhoE